MWVHGTPESAVDATLSTLQGAPKSVMRYPQSETQDHVRWTCSLSPLSQIDRTCTQAFEVCTHSIPIAARRSTPTPFPSLGPGELRGRAERAGSEQMGAHCRGGKVTLRKFSGSQLDGGTQSTLLTTVTPSTQPDTQ